MAKKSAPVAEEFSVDKILGNLATGIKKKEANHLQYLHQFDPEFEGQRHYKQIEFHRSQANGRQFLGGNRSGKTVAGINEDIMWARGQHPFIKDMPPFTIGRIVTVDYKNGMHKIILPQLKQWLPPSSLVNGSWEDSWDGNLYTLTLQNGSEIEIMSHEQPLEKFAGVPRHWIHFDEEPPFDIFKECKARLADYNGRWWMTMTPVEGMTWTYEEIWEKRHTNLIDVVQVHQDENPYLNAEGRKNLQEGYDQIEQEIRAEGKYVAISGLVFKTFDPEIHVIPSIIPPSSGWTHYRSLDHGFNNPTAVYCHAVNSKDGTVITYREHYRREWVIQQHAEFLKDEEAKLRDEHGILFFLSIADPAITQRSAVTGLSVQIEYGQHGINWALGAKRDVNAGLDKMNNYLRLGKWFITEDCPNLIKEMRKYKRAQYATSKLREKNNPKEEPQKKDDHAIDSTRYFFSYMPDLDVKAPTPDAIVRPNLLGAPTTVLRYPQRIDPNFDRSNFDFGEPKFVTDEYVGEF